MERWIHSVDTMQMAEDNRPSTRKMWLALAWVTPVGIPATIGLAYAFAPAWIPRDTLLLAALSFPLVWFPVTLANSIYLGRDLTEVNEPRMKDPTATWVVTFCVFVAHCVASAIASFLVLGIARK